MKFRISNLWAAAMFVLMLAAAKTCTQDSPYQVASASMEEADKWADKFYEQVLKLPNRIAKAQAVMLDNELQPSEAGQDAGFHDNPLLLDGKPFEWADFSISSKGMLTVVEGNPESPEAVKILFKIYLRRNGEIITEGKSDINREVFEIEISEVLSVAKDGDQLIIAPVRECDWKAKRILKVIGGC
jgi:hypothetical protein